MWTRHIGMLLLVGSLLGAAVRIHHPAPPAGEHEEQQQELCTEQAPPAGHLDHDAPGAPCSSPSHCSHGCSGHHVVGPVLPGAIGFDHALAGFIADRSDALLIGGIRSIDHPPKV